METVDWFEFDAVSRNLLDRVAQGEKITITKNGVPVAMLVPVEQPIRRSRDQVIKELKEFGRGRKLPDGMNIRDLIEEGRRF